MKDTIETIKKGLFNYKDIEGGIIALDQAIMLLKRIKEIKDDIEEDILIKMKDENIDGVTIGGNYYYKKEKTINKFDSDLIKHCMVSDNLQIRNIAMASLPKNPKFKKIEAIKLMKMIGQITHWEDHEEKLEIKFIPEGLKKELKSKKQIKRG